MKINNITTQQNRNQNFRGSLADSATNFIAKHPGAIAGLAGASVVAQKVVMSGSEAIIGPAMDIGIGKAITKITDEKDNRTNEASKTQAVRTFAQSVGGTIVGVVIRLACIAGATAALTSLAKGNSDKASSVADTLLNDGKKVIDKTKPYEFTEHMTKWGKSVGGAVAAGVMMFTNFIIDAPFINWINKKTTNLVDKFKKPSSEEVAKEVK